MADVKEKDLAAKTTLSTSDYLRVVGSDNASYKQLVSDVAKCIVENYSGSTIAGSAQTIKAALDNLNSKLDGIVGFYRTKTTINVTKTITLSNSYRGILIFLDSNQTRCGMYLVFTTGSGVITQVTAVAASGITFNLSTANQYKVTANGNATVVALTIEGTAS